MEIQALHVEEFWRDGRGPELQKVHYGETGTDLKAIDYTNPDGDAGHLLFMKPQVFMFTPEEVENYATSTVNWLDTGKAAIVCLGRSPWLMSFAQYHLKACSHFRIMFYDDFLDLICEGIAVQAGCYQGDPDA